MDGSGPIKIAGIEVLAEELTPLVERLLRMIETTSSKRPVDLLLTRLSETLDLGGDAPVP